MPVSAQDAVEQQAYSKSAQELAMQLLAKQKAEGLRRINIAEAQAKGLPHAEDTKAKESPAHTTQVKEQRSRYDSNSLVEIDESTRSSLANLLEERLADAQQLRDAPDATPLTDIDKMVLKHASEFANKLRKNEDLKKDELTIIWGVLYDEIMQVAIASGRFTREMSPAGVKKRFLRADIPIDAQTTTKTFTPIEQTAFVRVGRLRSTVDNPQAADTYLISLDKQRRQMELAIFNQSFDLAIFPDTSAPNPAASGLNNDSRAHGLILDELQKILAERHQGRSYAELWQADELKIEAMQAYHDALNRAVSEAAGEKAKGLLHSDKPEADAGIIRAQAEKERKKVDNPADKEEVAMLEAEINRANARRDAAKNRITAAENRLEAINEEIAIAYRDVTRLKSKRNAIENQYNSQITNLKNQITKVDSDIANLPSIGADKDRDKLRGTFRDQRIKLEDQKNALEEKIKVAYLDEVEADSKKAGLEAEKNRLEAKGTPPPDGSLQEFKAAVVARLAEKTAAEEALKKKKESLPKPENANALQLWADVVDKYTDVIDKQFNQHNGNMFSREKLGDVTTSADGNVVGADLIQQHLFGLHTRSEVKDGDVVKVPGYSSADFDPALARKMVSNEAIVRAIIHEFKIDPQTITIDGDTAQSLLDRLTTHIKPGLAAARSAKDATRIASFETSLKANETALLKTFLPFIRQASPIQTSKVLSYIIHEGAKQAEKGKAFMELGEKETSTLRTLQITEKTIREENIGAAELSNGQIVAEVVGNNIKFGRARGADGKPSDLYLPIRFRVYESPTRVGTEQAVEVYVDQNLLQCLPDRLSDLQAMDVYKHLNGQFDQFYYDGRLKTMYPTIDKTTGRKQFVFGTPAGDHDKPQLVPEIIRISKPRLPSDRLRPADSRIAERSRSLDQLFTDLDVFVEQGSIKLSETLTASIGNSLVDMRPEDRRLLIQGVNHELIIHSNTTEPPAYRITFENGNIFIQEVDAQGLKDAITNIETARKGLNDAFIARRTAEMEILNPQKSRLQRAIIRHLPERFWPKETTEGNLKQIESNEKRLAQELENIRKANTPEGKVNRGLDGLIGAVDNLDFSNISLSIAVLDSRLEAVEDEAVSIFSANHAGGRGINLNTAIPDLERMIQTIDDQDIETYLQGIFRSNVRTSEKQITHLLNTLSHIAKEAKGNEKVEIKDALSNLKRMKKELERVKKQTQEISSKIHTLKNLKRSNLNQISTAGEVFDTFISTIKDIRSHTLSNMNDCLAEIIGFDGYKERSIQKLREGQRTVMTRLAERDTTIQAQLAKIDEFKIKAEAEEQAAQELRIKRTEPTAQETADAERNVAVKEAARATAEKKFAQFQQDKQSYDPAVIDPEKVTIIPALQNALNKATDVKSRIEVSESKLADIEKELKGRVNDIRQTIINIRTETDPHEKDRLKDEVRDQVNDISYDSKLKDLNKARDDLQDTASQLTAALHLFNAIVDPEIRDLITPTIQNINEILHRIVDIQTTINELDQRLKVVVIKVQEAITNGTDIPDLVANELDATFQILLTRLKDMQSVHANLNNTTDQIEQAKEWLNNYTPAGIDDRIKVAETALAAATDEKAKAEKQLAAVQARKQTASPEVISDKEEIRPYFARKLQDYMQTKGQNLSNEERAELQRKFEVIQIAIGKEALKAMQRF